MNNQSGCSWKEENRNNFYSKPVDLSQEITNNNIYREIDSELEALDYSKK